MTPTRANLSSQLARARSTGGAEESKFDCIDPKILQDLLEAAVQNPVREDEIVNENDTETESVTPAAFQGRGGTHQRVTNPYAKKRNITSGVPGTSLDTHQNQGHVSNGPNQNSDTVGDLMEEDEEEEEEDEEEEEEVTFLQVAASAPPANNPPPLEIPAQVKPKPTRPFMTRYDVKLSVPPVDKSADALVALSETIKAFWSQIKELDKSLVIYPWAEGSNKAALMMIERLPQRPSDLQAFFDRALPRKNGGTLYVSVYLGHTETFKKLHSDVKYWLEGESSGWYIKALQVEKSVVAGWLMYSDLDTDQDLLAQAIFKMSGVKVGLRWRAISVKTSIKLAESQLVKAMHVEVDKTFETRDKKRLAALYSSESEGPFPLGRKLHLVPQYQDVTTPASLAKLDRARIRQAAFLVNITRLANDDVGVLDFHDPAWNGTLRDIIMKIPVSEDPSRSLFVSVDKHFTGQGVMFRFTEPNLDEAKACINGLLPYLKSMGPDNVHSRLEKCFTPDAVLRS